MPAALLIPAIFGSLAFYALGSLSVRDRLAPGSAGVVAPSGAESFARVGAIVLNANLNFLLWIILVPASVDLVGVLLTAVGAASAFRRVARSARYQALLGWSSWLMPMSWPAIAVGLLVFLFGWVTAIWGVVLVRIDRGTGSVELSGLPSVFGFRGGFALGSFTFILATAPTPFSEAGISAHEAGHALNVAAFGSVWHLVGNGVEQNVRPFARGAHAYGELLAESRHPDPSQPFLSQWS